MHETKFSISHLESPLAGELLSHGHHVIRGWVWPKPGRHIVNVRARLSGRVFAGIHGWPRTDLPEQCDTRGRPALAGFSIIVELPAGEVEVVLEALEIEGQWTPFDTVTCLIANQSRQVDQSQQLRPLGWREFSRGLEHLLRARRSRPMASWVRLAVELSGDLPVSQDQLFAADPFIGHADEPALVNRSKFGLLPVVGYIFHKTEVIKRLWVTADLMVLQPLEFGRSTANIVDQFPHYPAAASAGYEGYVDVPPQLPNPVTLRLYAEMPDGSLHLVQIRAIRRHDVEEEKFPYPALTNVDFDEAMAAWLSALRVRGFSVKTESELSRELERLRLGATRPPANPRPTTPIIPPPGSPRPARHLVLVSHNLNLEGAPLFLLDLARHHAANGAELTLVSAADGPLRDRFTACGARIVLVDPTPVFSAGSEADAENAVNALGREFDFKTGDLVITNTFTTFWAVLAAKNVGQRVLSYIHESTSPSAFYGGSVHHAVVALIDEALARADAVSFTSEATRRYHTGTGRLVNAVLTPGWVDIAAVDAWRAAHSREDLRLRFGVNLADILVTNVGTVCDRKAQVSFVRSVDLFNYRYPDLAARTKFVLLGGRQAPFDEFLRQILANLRLPNLVVHPETPDYLGYYVAADLSVCSSYEESSPRVVFEAMACQVPLLASDIPGISEIARDGIEAVLVPAGHTSAWADAMAKCLQEPGTGQEMAARARERLRSHFSAAIVLPSHRRLAEDVANGVFMR